MYIICIIVYKYIHNECIKVHLCTYTLHIIQTIYEYVVYMYTLDRHYVYINIICMIYIICTYINT